MQVTVSGVVSLDHDIRDEVDGEAGAFGDTGTDKTVQTGAVASRGYLDRECFLPHPRTDFV
jgi:hypothetical protein